MATSAVEALERARSAFEKRSYETAISFCKEALAMVDTDMSGSAAMRLRADILLLLSEINDVTGLWVDSLLYLDGVTQISTALSDTKMRVESLIRAGNIISKKGRWDDALKKFEKAEEAATKNGIHKLLGRALIGKGTILWRMGRYAEAVREADRTSKISGNIHDLQLVGTAHALTASVRFDQGNYAASIEANRKALECFEGVEDVYQIARVLNNIGETYKVIGDYPQAIENLERCLKVAEESGNRRNMGYALMNIAECKVRGGDPAAAKNAAARAESALAGMEDRYAHANLATVWALIHVAKKEAKESFAYFDRALAQMKELKIPYDTGVVQLEYGLAALHFKDRERAKEMLSDAIDSFQDAGNKAMMAKVEEAFASIKE
ncbi:MAG: tetratricopeptide repeat protein [Euryarchaeota archaeon]|nr:tetratricopeptide repeat protein [Euryarchaeota archaeon]